MYRKTLVNAEFAPVLFGNLFGIYICVLRFVSWKIKTGSSYRKTFVNAELHPFYFGNPSGIYSHPISMKL